MINKKNTLLFLLLSFLNINFSMQNSLKSKENGQGEHKISSFIENQTKKKYFVPCATATFFVTAKFAPLIINLSKFTKLTEINEFLGPITTTESALTLLKSAFVASHLTTEFKLKNKENKTSASDYAYKISLFVLLGFYTHKTFKNLLKAEKSRNLKTLFENLLENYGTIGVVNTLIKGMKNNDKSLIERSEINGITKKDQKLIYYGFLITLLLLWERRIGKDFSRDTILKILSLAVLTYDFAPQYNDALKKLLILIFLGYSIKKFYTNSQSSLEQSEIKLIALEDITGTIGKIFSLPVAFNSLIDFFNSHIFPKSEENNSHIFPKSEENINNKELLKYLPVIWAPDKQNEYLYKQTETKNDDANFQEESHNTNTSHPTKTHFNNDVSSNYSQGNRNEEEN